MDDRLFRDRGSLLLFGAALLLAAGSLLVGLSVIAGGAGWAVALQPWLDATGEGRLPVAFESLCFLAAGLVCAVRWRDGMRTGDRWIRHWGGAALLFAVLAAEKALGLHKVAASIVGAQYGTYRGGMLGTFVAPAVVVLAFLAWAYGGLLKSLPLRTLRGLAWGGAILLAGGVGMKLAGAVWTKLTGGQDAIQVLIGNGEEAGEMLGAAILFRVLWLHARAGRAGQSRQSAQTGTAGLD